ncbi:MAG: hypothetical protein KGV59_01550 [Tenacibaculum sp.]|nr:hypothetical protein [Tenacibaculum sp.]
MEQCPAKEFNWCISNGIRIYPKPLDNYGKRLKIVVENKGNPKEGTEIYNNKEVYTKIYELYRLIYNRENG